MKRFIIAIFIFLFALTCVSTFASGSAASSAVNGSKALVQASYVLEEEFIYVRVLIEGRWWTYVYALDGSFIVAIPDEDE